VTEFTASVSHMSPGEQYNARLLRLVQRSFQMPSRVECIYDYGCVSLMVCRMPSIAGIKLMEVSLTFQTAYVTKRCDSLDSMKCESVLPV
jgi:hypothetical protein